MPNQSEMKVITTLTKEQIDLLIKTGAVCHDNGINYLHLPYWYKDLGAGEFEVLTEDELPEYLHSLVESEKIKELRKELELTDELYEGIKKVLEAIPECLTHGNLCIPHALEWIEEKKSNEEKTNDLPISSINDLFKKANEHVKKWHPDNY